MEEPPRRGRGRPRIHPLPDAVTREYDIEKPREEIDHVTFYPDLDSRLPLAVAFRNSVAPSAADVRLDGLKEASFRSIEASDSSADSQTPQAVKKRKINTYIRETDDARAPLWYDMDEQDLVFLETLNRARLKRGLESISESLFEEAIACLEREWHVTAQRERAAPAKWTPEEDLAHRFGSDDGVGLPDQPCAVCFKTEDKPQNMIVFCEGCRIAVHQECYGVVFIPEGAWLCRRCACGATDVRCVFCPLRTGAFKRTQSGAWAHLQCALWLPEVSVTSAAYMEPIDGYERVPRDRWGLLCGVCKRKGGACVQCARGACVAAYHVTCARRAGLTMRRRGPDLDAQGDVFCERHSDPKNRPVSEAEYKMRKAQLEKARKYFEAHLDEHKTKIIAPQQFLDVLEREVGGGQVFCEVVCRYWALKREKKGGRLVRIEDWGLEAEGADARIAWNNVLQNDIKRMEGVVKGIVKRAELWSKASELDVLIEKKTLEQVSGE